MTSVEEAVLKAAAPYGFTFNEPYINGYSFYDANNQPYNARADFGRPAQDITLEAKPNHLAIHDNQEYADKALDNATRYAKTKKGRHLAIRDNSWSNCLIKHSQQHMRMEPLSHLMVFADHIPYWLCVSLIEHNILFCHVDNLGSMLASIRWAKKWDVNIFVTYNHPDGREIRIPVNSIKKQQEATNALPEGFIQPTGFMCDHIKVSEFKKYPSIIINKKDCK